LYFQINMKTKTSPGKTLFVLESPMDGRGKWLFIINAVIYFGLLVLIVWAFFFLPPPDAKMFVMYILFGSIGGVAGYRYFSNSWRMDTLLVTADTVTLKEVAGFVKRKRIFERVFISNVRFLERPVLTEHPLASKSFDFLGVQTEQVVLNEMFGDNKASFDYQGKSIMFGRHLYSWDVEQIRDAILGKTAVREETLPWNKPESWETYWQQYELFLTLLQDEEQRFILEDARYAKLFVDGTADGWYDHRKKLKQLRERYIDQLTFPEKQRLDHLIEILDARVF
jgi:hypothetical protein